LEKVNDMALKPWQKSDGIKEGSQEPQKWKFANLRGGRSEGVLMFIERSRRTTFSFDNFVLAKKTPGSGIEITGEATHALLRPPNPASLKTCIVPASLTANRRETQMQSSQVYKHNAYKHALDSLHEANFSDHPSLALPGGSKGYPETQTSIGGFI
jgi:hypothetical protein